MLNLHILAVFVWGVLIISLAKSVNCKENSKILAILSLIAMVFVLYIGTKLMLAFPQIAKSGKWIHIKLSIDIIAMLLNIYLALIVLKNKQLSFIKSQAFFWITIVMFILMYYFTLFKPF